MIDLKIRISPEHVKQWYQAALNERKDLALNRKRCPIAQALMLSDGDILSPDADRTIIRFSRRSTQSRYFYRTPQNAVRFITTLDACVEREDPEPSPTVARGFILKLGNDDLINIEPRRQRSPRTAVSNMLKAAAVHVETTGEKTVKERKPTSRRSTASQRN